MFRRKNYFIKKGFQFSFVYKFILLLLLESVLIGGLFMYISSDTLTTGYSDSLLKVESTRNFFFVPFVLIVLIVVFGVSLMGMVVFILMSHRIAGPLYRFEKVLGQLTGGDLTAMVRLRNTDQLVEFEKCMNIFIETLSRRISAIKARLKEAQGYLDEVKDPQLASKLRQDLNSIRDEINYFKIPADLKNKQ